MKNPTYKIFKTVKELKDNYRNSTIQIIDGLYFSQYKTIKMCEFYSNSRYLGSGVSDARFGIGIGANTNKDALGRDKPFYNIVNYRVMLAKTATDLDIKDIQIVSDDPKHQVQSMLLNKEAYEWMKATGFSLTLNQMGSSRPKYGGYLIKKSFVDKELKIDVVDWNKVETDQSDILGGPIVECHYMSPVELSKKSDSWENVNEVLEAFEKSREKNKTARIEVYEVHGEFPKCIYNDAEGVVDKENDDYEYSLQRYYIANVLEKYYLMSCDEIDELPYEYLAWESMPGRGLGKGVIEDSEEAQVWTNDSVINEKNAMDLAGKVFVKTTSKKIGNNILEMDNGKMFELEAGSDINSFNLVPAALGQFQVQIDKWKVQADNVTSSYDAATGEQPTSGTPYSTVALLNSVATKPFDYRREEWGIHLTKVFNEWVIPYLITTITKKHILVSDYSDQELELIDESFANKNATQDIIDRAIAGTPTSPDQQTEITNGYKNHIKKLGKKRFIEIPKDYFDDIKSKVTVVTTGEQKNKAAILQSLSTIMDTVIKSYNPQTGKFGVLEDPTLSKIFSTIVENTGAGISPVSLGLGKITSPTTPPPAQAPTAPVASPITSPQLTPQ